MSRAKRKKRSSPWPFAASARGLGQIVDLAAREKGVSFRTDVRFHATRKWEFDFGCDELRIAIEYEGGGYSNLGHTRPERFRSDMEKYNEGQLSGWMILRFGPDETRSGTALETILRAITAKTSGIDRDAPRRAPAHLGRDE